MSDIDDLMDEIRGYLAHLTLPHQASAIVMDLFLLSDVHHLSDDPRVTELRKRFQASYGTEAQDQLLDHQVRYASRLACAPGKLIYEEMHKLFSLLDEVHALRASGYSGDDALLRQMNTDVRSRFAAQQKMARLVAEDKVEEWSRPLWWYADNLQLR